MRGGLVSCSGVSILGGLGVVLFFDRKRETMLDMEKPCCDDLVGTKTAMLFTIIQKNCKENLESAIEE
jgi:hypothetical protein